MTLGASNGGQLRSAEYRARTCRCGRWTGTTRWHTSSAKVDERDCNDASTWGRETIVAEAAPSVVGAWSNAQAGTPRRGAR